MVPAPEESTGSVDNAAQPSPVQPVEPMQPLEPAEPVQLPTLEEVIESVCW